MGFSSCDEQRLVSSAVPGLLMAMIVLSQHAGCRACGLSRCSARTLLPRGMWDVPGPGIKPMSRGRQILHHWTTREVLLSVIYIYFKFVRVTQKQLLCYTLKYTVPSSSVGKIPWRRKWWPTPVFLPGKSHEQSGLAGCSPWGRKESDTAQWLNSNRWSHHPG